MSSPNPVLPNSYRSPQPAPQAPTPLQPRPLRTVKQVLLSYFYWTYSRGSFHYDVMVTLILAFIFLAPLWINFRDKPVERSPYQTEVVVKPEGNGFLYKVDAAAIQPGSDDQVRDQLLRAIEPIAGEIRIDRYEAVRDSKHNIVAYNVWGHR